MGLLGFDMFFDLFGGQFVPEENVLGRRVPDGSGEPGPKRPLAT